MADKLSQVGKTINRFSHETRDTTRYISRNFSLVEKSSDVVGILYPYKLEFNIYSGQSALLTLEFTDRFRRI